MADLATKKLWLAEAEIALHKLSTGQQVVSVQYDEQSRTEWRASSMTQLSAYITRLRAEIATEEGTDTGKRRSIAVSY